MLRRTLGFSVVLVLALTACDGDKDNATSTAKGVV